MRLNINHISTYTYGKPVFLEPHHLYFQPLSRSYFEVVDFQMGILPQPSGQSVRIDAENNAYTQCWFNELLETLRVEVKLVIETKPFNQFGYFLEQEAKTNFQEVLAIYSKQQTKLSEEVISFVEAINEADATNFVGKLCEQISSHCKHGHSDEMELLSPNDCFIAQQGSCRDLAWLMMEMLRLRKIPARFVSGYSFNPEITGHELHAWVEAWLPGAGWVALDPSTGIFITETYIPLAVSYHPVNTLPIQGAYRGSASAHLATTVSIDAVE